MNEFIHEQNELNKELISRYVDGNVTSEEKTKAEDLILSDAALKEYYLELKKLNDVLNILPEEKPSPDWERKIHSSLLKNINREGPKMKKIPIYKHYALMTILAMVVIGGLLTANMYVHRGIHGRMRSASDYIAEQQPASNTPTKKVLSSQPTQTQTQLAQAIKYEPYYLSSTYEVKDREVDEIQYTEGTYSRDGKTLRTRTARGYEKEALLDKRPSAPVSEAVELYGKNIPEGGLYLSMNFSNEDKAAMGIGLEEIPSDAWRYNPNFHTEEYDKVSENEFMLVKDNPLSTFSIDVDTASYSNVRRFLNSNQLPPADAVRIEELINYFTYDYPQPKGDQPFSISLNAATCPWNTKHELVRIGLQGMTLNAQNLPPSNLVFLIDVSGSMQSANKLPLLKTAFKMMAKQLSANERVAIVVYAGAERMVLNSTPGSEKQKILSAIDQLRAGGSTAGAAGIKLAYKIAQDNFIKGGNNRVILATDGDFNVGVSSNAELERLIEQKRKQGVFLTVLGFGRGNYKDSKMEKLADKGNGNYYYIDTQREADKVLVQELGSTLFTIAKDVKIQIDFNPAKVKAYRLIGYENRILAKEDFNDDTKDAGELGAGHNVTALYELIPADSAEAVRKADDSVYQQTQIVESPDLLTVKLRYKKPDEDTSKLIQESIRQDEITSTLQGDFQFAASVAEFGMLLRNSQFKGTASYDDVIQSAQHSKGKDAFGYRAEFIELVRKAKQLDNRVSAVDNNPEVNGPDDSGSSGIIFKGQK